MAGPHIFKFFSEFSDEVGKMRYGSGAPSRAAMFDNFVESLPAEVQRRALIQLCDEAPRMKTPPTPEDVERLRQELSGAAVATTLGTAIKAIDAEHVTKQWSKIIDRLKTDPEGAITASRALLESVCLYILNELGEKVDAKGDLPALYKATAERLRLAATKEDDTAARQVLGSCAGLVQGIATVRNQLGDAHGKLGGPEALHRFAHLSANAAGTVAVFLIETYSSMRKR